jgi:hypothetical protein
VPGQFGGRGLAVTTKTFRVEAEGLIDGQVRARLTTVVQVGSQTPGGAITVMEWLPDR